LTRTQRLRTGLNYLGQLRAYSYADLLLMLSAAGAGALVDVRASLLWFGFLIHLEWRHRDVGRARWPWYAGTMLWLAAIVLTGFAALPAIAFSLMYSLKKRYPVIALVSPFVNGCIKTSLALLAPGAGFVFLLIVCTSTALRNLLGDVRDAGKDAAEGVKSLPVLAGYRRNTAWVYPIGLASTSVLWTVYGHLPLTWLIVAGLVQVGTYRLTPR
jgi:hypothetical protein